VCRTGMLLSHHVVSVFMIINRMSEEDMSQVQV